MKTKLTEIKVPPWNSTSQTIRLPVLKLCHNPSLITSNQWEQLTDQKAPDTVSPLHCVGCFDTKTQRDKGMFLNCFVTSSLSPRTVNVPHPHTHSVSLEDVLLGVLKSQVTTCRASELAEGCCRAHGNPRLPTASHLPSISSTVAAGLSYTYLQRVVSAQWFSPGWNPLFRQARFSHFLTAPQQRKEREALAKNGTWTDLERL